MDFKEVVGGLAVLIGFIGYIPYLKDTFAGRTKPHLFSWLLWGILESIAVIASFQEGGGPGVWVTAFSALIALVIAAKAFFTGEKNITRLDWGGFIGAILGIIIWQLTKDPTGAVIIVTITDALAFIPTYRKGYEKPNEETVSEFVASSIKLALGIVALRNYNLVTVLYPASLVFTNGIFSLMVWSRRKKLKLV